MPSGTGNPNHHGTLTAGQIDTITMSQPWRTLQVINVDGSARIDYTTDGSTPVEGGSPTGRVLPAAVCADSVAGFTESPSTDVETPITVKLISVGTPAYSIIGEN